MTVTVPPPATTGATSAARGVSSRRRSVAELRAFASARLSNRKRRHRPRPVVRAWLGIALVGAGAAFFFLAFALVALLVLDSLVGPALQQATRPLGL